MNKKGDSGEIIGAIAMIAVVLIVVLIVLSSQGIEIPFLDSMSANGALNVVVDLATKTINILKDISVPTGLDDNQEVIAFAMFLLVWIIGTKSLKNFFQSSTVAFGVGFLVAAIAARGLNSLIIDKYVIGSPVAAGAFLVGILPVLIFYGLMDNWSGGKFLTKFLVWTIFAMTYFLVFWFGFDSKILALTYLACIEIAAITETFLPYIIYFRRTTGSRDLGKFMATEGQQFKDWQDALTGATTAAKKAKIKAPWEI